MNVHWLQHVPFEDLGAMEPWLRGRGADVHCSRMHAGDPVPDVAGVDLLVAMGGPMSVNDEAAHPWLAPEKRCIAQAVRTAVPVLGICLGAQLIASALGARVRPALGREIGWFPVHPAPGGAGHPLADLFTEPLETFHWHGESFDLPAGATLLASSEGCAHQAFALGEKVIGIQYHLETTPGSARALIEHSRDEMTPARYVQSAESILADDDRFRRINLRMEALLARLSGLSP